MKCRYCKTSYYCKPLAGLSHYPDLHHGPLACPEPPPGESVPQHPDHHQHKMKETWIIIARPIVPAMEN